MTTPTQPLTPEQINVMIAESLGWKRVNLFYTHCYPLGLHHAKRVGAYAPNFHGSLDACATFEAGLTDDEYARYAIMLQDVVADSMPCRPLAIGERQLFPIILAPAGYIRYISATAPQRCTAYLKTKGLIK